MSTVANEDKFSALLSAYLADPSCSADELEQFLSSRYKLDVHVPMADEELEERLEHMKNIQRLLDENEVEVGDAEMTRIAASFCLLIPLAKLRDLRDDIKTGHEHLERALQNLLQTVTLFRTCKLYKDPEEKEETNTSVQGSLNQELEVVKILEEQGELATTQAKRKNKRKADCVAEQTQSGGKNKKVASSGRSSGQLSSAKTHTSNLPSKNSPAASFGELTDSKWRNKAEVKKCLVRDSKNCIFTDCKIVEVCHIIGWALQSTGKKRDRVRKSMEEFFAHFGETDSLDHRLCNAESTDKSWNMLTLSRLLHSLWGDGRIAIQCKGITPTLDKAGRLLPNPSVITLRIFWLNVRTEWRANDKFKLDYTTLSEMSRNRFLPKPLPGNRAFRDKDGRCVMSGHEVDIVLPFQEAQNMQILIDAQWHYLNVWAMSGAATDFALAKPEDFEPDYCGELLLEGALPTSEHGTDIAHWLEGLP